MGQTPIADEPQKIFKYARPGCRTVIFSCGLQRETASNFQLFDFEVDDSLQPGEHNPPALPRIWSVALTAENAQIT